MHLRNFTTRAATRAARLRRPALLAFALLLALASLAYRGAQAEPTLGQAAWIGDAALLADMPHAAGAAAPARYRYAAATGHNIGPHVAAFYQHGGLPIFGLPLTEEIVEDGARVQYFERARFELRPDGQVALTPLGALLTRDRTEPAFARRLAPGARASDLDLDRGLFRTSQAVSGLLRAAGPIPALRAYDRLTGHTLGGAFAAFWRARGGVELFGRPISEEFEEVNPHDGQRYLVQYFERARFERHSELAGGASEVLLGLLGREYADARALDPALRAPAQPIVALGAASVAFSPAAAREHNIALVAGYLDGLIVPPGSEQSFLEAIGEVSRAAGYLADDATVGRRVTKEIGGGICYASTALYRAVFRAGLPILERHPHSLLIDRRSAMPGFDAAVYSPGMDLRWRNDTPHPVMVAASLDAASSAISVELWGVGDGRSVAVRGPTIRNRRPAPADTWRYDATLRAGHSRRVAQGSEGMDVTIGRVVRDAGGQTLRQDTFRTHYEPHGALYVYGPGVTPP